MDESPFEGTLVLELDEKRIEQNSGLGTPSRFLRPAARGSRSLTK
jgi:hypothetical protein